MNLEIFFCTYLFELFSYPAQTYLKFSPILFITDSKYTKHAHKILIYREMSFDGSWNSWMLSKYVDIKQLMQNGDMVAFRFTSCTVSKLLYVLLRTSLFREKNTLIFKRIEILYMIFYITKRRRS